MPYKEYKSINFYDISIQIQKYWDDNNIFQKTISSRNKDSKNFIFYEGPPSANGVPGIHHVMSRTVKDVFCRYKTLKGFKVLRKGGWDTHGLPVELQVEKKLNINKDDIGNKISVEEYNKECRKTVMEFKNKWEELTIKMGYWLDLEDSYITYKNEYIESIWWSLKTLYKKGLLYKGYTIQPFSPAAGTGLSSHELNMPGAYKDIKDTSIVAQFKLLKNNRTFCFMAFKPLTGKKHQLRILSQKISCPIVGDTKYNLDKKFSSENLKLNAYYLKFTINNQEYKFKSNLPKDFKNFLFNEKFNFNKNEDFLKFF